MWKQANFWGCEGIFLEVPQTWPKNLCAPTFPIQSFLSTKHEDQNKVFMFSEMYDSKEDSPAWSLWNPLKKGAMDLSNTEQSGASKEKKVFNWSRGAPFFGAKSRIQTYFIIQSHLKVSKHLCPNFQRFCLDFGQIKLLWERFHPLLSQLLHHYFHVGLLWL